MTWWAVPLAAAVSLVWNASRYESAPCIVTRSAKLFLWLMFWMLLIGAALFLLSYNL